MEFRNKITKLESEKIAYFTALSLIFSYAELFIPKIIPFLKFGLSNIVILSAFSLNFFSFFILTVLKSVCSSIFSGTIFTPFFLISLAQSVLSGIFMFVLFKLNKIFREKLLGIYGISICGSVLSGVIQTFLASLYLGKEIFSLIGIILIFNLISGIVTAFLTNFFKIPEKIPHLPERNQKKFSKKNAPTIFLFSLSTLSIFFFENLYILIVITFVCIVFQICSGKKFKILPHFLLWIFIIFTSLLSVNGKILFSIGNFSITEGALLSGIKKSLKLSAITSLSQAAVKTDISFQGILGDSFEYFKILLQKFNLQEGNLIQKIKNTFQN